MAANNSPTGPKRRHYLAAVLLGTALSTLGVSRAQATDTGQAGAKAVTDISRYCTACWRNARLPADCWGDCTQEVFSRLVQTIDQGKWNQVFQAEGAERQEFLRAIDAVKKRTQRALKRSTNLNGIVPDDRASEERAKTDERELVCQAAEEVLSERQQQILRMSFEGWAVQEIADELGVAPERVSDEKYKAVRKLRQHLQTASCANVG